MGCIHIYAFSDCFRLFLKCASHFYGYSEIRLQSSFGENGTVCGQRI